MQKRNKKAEVFGLSFGVIFSIIIIIFILVVMGIAINYFLDMKKCTQIGLFTSDLQSDIDKAWSSQKSGFEFKGSLPTNIEYVCFANLSNSLKGESLESEIYSDISVYKSSDGTMFFYPRENACNMPYINVKHISLEKITETKNPYCIKVENGEITIQIEKDFNDALVILK